MTVAFECEPKSAPTVLFSCKSWTTYSCHIKCFDRSQTAWHSFPGRAESQCAGTSQSPARWLNRISKAQPRSFQRQGQQQKWQPHAKRRSTLIERPVTSSSLLWWKGWASSAPQPAKSSVVWVTISNSSGEARDMFPLPQNLSGLAAFQRCPTPRLLCRR